MKAVIELVKNKKNSKICVCKNACRNVCKNACGGVCKGARKKVIKKAGFTLMELLVVLAIFALIMGVALFNQASLTSNVLVTNLAYETALAVREAQTYGLGVKALGGNTTFDKGYGAYFDSNNLYEITVFNDANNDKRYTDLTELQSLYEIKNQRGNKIKSICVHDTDPATCVPVDSGKKLSIMFKRPNPEANFYVIDTASGANPAIGPAEIVVGSVDDSSCRRIVVEVTGQIRVETMMGCTP